MDEAEERRIWKRDAAELRRSEVYPALLRLRAALRRQTPADRMLLAWVESARGAGGHKGRPYRTR